MAKPLGVHRVSPLDLIAKRELEEASAHRAVTASQRAEKWIAGLTAITGLLGTVLLVKGPETVDKLTPVAKGWLAAFFAFALFLLAAATYSAYSAAFGDPLAPSKMRLETSEGLHARREAFRFAEEDRINGELATAIRRLFLGLTFLALGVAVTWFAKPPAPDPPKATCLYSGSEVVLKLPGDSISALGIAGGYSIKPC